MCPPPCGPKRTPRRSCKLKRIYAAEFELGYYKVFAESSTIRGLIDRLWRTQDLACLSHQAQAMGDDSDAESARKLDKFLKKYYEGTLKSKDIQNLDLEFSIGALKCTAFAAGEDEVVALIAANRETKPEPVQPQRKHHNSDQDALAHVKKHLGRPDITTFEEAGLALQEAFESDDPALVEIKNCPLCQNFLGGCYWLGKGVDFDYEKAYELYEKAAKSGLAKAQANFGIVLLSNKAGKRHLRAARFWYEKAAEQGNEVAIDHIKEMGNDLTSVLEGQSHGDHNDAVVSGELGECIQEVFQTVHIESAADDVTCFVTEDGYPKRLSVAEFQKTDGPISLDGLTVKNDSKIQLVSLFPEVKDGAETELKVERILEWENGCEATIEATNGNRTFSFFLVNYFAHKHHLLPGDVYTFRLAALAYTAKEQEQKEFQFEGQKALDFLAKIGDDPKYDADGNLEPVKFDLAHLVAFNQVEEKYPEESQYVSPIKSVEEFTAWGGDIYKLGIGLDPEEEQVIPLYVKKSVIQCTPEVGMSIQGVAWLQGTLVEKSMREYLKLRRGKDFPISGGNGSSKEEAIVIESENNAEAVGLEYAVLREYYATKVKTWKLGIQHLIGGEDGRHYDLLEIKIKGCDDSETTEEWYFDITKGFGN